MALFHLTAILTYLHVMHMSKSVRAIPLPNMTNIGVIDQKRMIIHYLPN